MAKIKKIALGIFAISLVYYALMAAHVITWYFAGQDVGDWLASANIWYVPQPYGSPLFILLLHAIGSIVHGQAQLIMINLLLCCVPSAITVTFVFLSAEKLTHNIKYSIIAAAVCLGTTTLLSQTIIIEEYALATMFVALAFYSYINGWFKRTALFLGLGTAVQIIVLPIAFFWMLIELKRWSELIKPAGIFILTGVLPYGMILIMMAMPNIPTLIAGNLSLNGLNQYLGSTGDTVGVISVTEFLKRIPDVLAIVFSTFGLAVIPIFLAIKRPLNNILKVSLAAIFFVVWLYATNADYTTWTFLSFGIPIACVLVAIGLNRMPVWGYKAVAISAVALISLNTFFYNGAAVTAANNHASDFVAELESLPQNSAVLCHNGGPYGLALFYVMTIRTDIIPIFMPLQKSAPQYIYNDYLKWMQRKYGVVATNSDEMISQLLQRGYDVFYVFKGNDKEDETVENLIMDKGQYGYMYEVIGVK